MVAVIGDVHGCYYTLAELYNKIKIKYEKIPIYCVGDLVDRGRNSYEVIDFIIQEKIKFTPGNHDYMFYHFFKDPTSVFARSWVFNGNEPTLESYEKHSEDIFKHIEVIKSAPLYFNLEDCFITHAGISYHYKKILPADFKKNLDLLESYIYNDFREDGGVLWTRHPLLNLGRLQIVGHTKQKEVNFDEDSNAAYIDTGACVGNKLSAVIAEKNKIVDIIDESTHLNDIF